jgi:hypothetical protein
MTAYKENPMAVDTGSGSPPATRRSGRLLCPRQGAYEQLRRRFEDISGDEPYIEIRSEGSP